MKFRTTLLALALGGAAVAAQAQQMRAPDNAGSRSYAELGYSHLSFSRSGLADIGDGGVLRGIVGYDFHPNFAFEGLLGLGVRDADIRGTVGATPFTGEIGLRHTAGLFIKPKLNVGPVELFARAGIARTKVRTTATAPGAAFAGSSSDSDGAYGAGLNWQFSPRSYVGFDLMRYYDKGGIKVDGATLSVGTRW